MGYAGKDRRDICLLSPAPESLKDAFSHRNLNPLEMSLEDAIARCRGSARAIVSISSPTELSKHLTAVLRPALENGAAFLAVDVEKDEFAQVPRMCGSQELSRRLKIPPRDADDAKFLPVLAFDTSPGWEQRVAQYCADKDPGRAFDENCMVNTSGLPEDKNFPDEEDILLVQRAFNECSSVELKYLAGGHSRAKGPWKVEAQFRDGRSPVTFVIKMGLLGEIKKEIDVMQDCFNHIPFRHYPPVAPDRCVTGATKRAIVSMLVEDAITYEQYLRNQAPENTIPKIFDGPLKLWRRLQRAIVSMLVEDAITYEQYLRNQAPENTIPKIFDGPLKLWRKLQGTTEINIGQLYRDRGVAPKEAWHLKDIWAATRKNDAQVLKYSELYDRLMSHVKIRTQYVLGHGDLHLRNVLIHESGEVLLIDFSEADRLPWSYDPATLDVALAFDIPEPFAGEAGVTDEQRFELYRLPLLEERALADPNHRITAILALRSWVRGSASEVELEYELAVAGRLIWWAKWRNSQIAYRCASRILAALRPRAV
jgi:hypothetical protein